MYNVPAIFAQDEFSPTPWLKLAGSARVDAHSKYGTFLSPRLSALMHTLASEWSIRASVGGGFAAPTPVVDEVVAAGLGALLPLRGLRAERAVTVSLDAKWADGGWDVNASVFTSEIRDPLDAISAPGEKLELVNQPGSRRVPGAEALIRYVAGPLQLITSWSYLDVIEVVRPGIRQGTPLVPRDSGELAGILERENLGRIGIELGYTGRQALTDDPYRSVSEPYFEINVLGELRFGAVAVFLNAINLTDVRQTHFDPLVRPTPGPGGNPITDVWAPLQGRTFNLGIRAEL
jgi:iron complex outermembrane receptor protein